MRRIGAAAILLTLVGCGREYGDTYEVLISPDLTPEQSTAALAAIDDWTANVPVTFHTVVADCGDLRDRQICIGLGKADAHGGPTGSLGCTNIDDGHDGGNVWVDPSQVDGHGLAWLFQQTVTHEMGHAMGLEHAPGVMNAWAIQATHTVACSDIGQWYSLRGRVVPPCGD